MSLLSKLESLERLRRSRTRGFPKPGKGFPQKGKPIKMIDHHSDGSLFFSGSRSREPITESIEELEKKYSLIIVKLKNKPDDRLA